MGAAEHDDDYRRKPHHTQHIYAPHDTRLFFLFAAPCAFFLLCVALLLLSHGLSIWLSGSAGPPMHRCCEREGATTDLHLIWSPALRLGLDWHWHWHCGFMLFYFAWHFGDFCLHTCTACVRGNVSGSFFFFFGCSGSHVHLFRRRYVYQMTVSTHRLSMHLLGHELCEHASEKSIYLHRLVRCGFE